MAAILVMEWFLIDHKIIYVPLEKRQKSKSYFPDKKTLDW